jgi:hypothetical protein
LATSFRRRTRLFAHRRSADTASPLTGVGIAPDDVHRLFSAFFTPHGAIFQFSLVMDFGAAAEGQLARVSGAVP